MSSPTSRSTAAVAAGQPAPPSSDRRRSHSPPSPDKAVRKRRKASRGATFTIDNDPYEANCTPELDDVGPCDTTVIGDGSLVNSTSGSVSGLPFSDSTPLRCSSAESLPDAWPLQAADNTEEKQSAEEDWVTDTSEEGSNADDNEHLPDARALTNDNEEHLPDAQAVSDNDDDSSSWEDLDTGTSSTPYHAYEQYALQQQRAGLLEDNNKENRRFDADDEEPQLTSIPVPSRAFYALHPSSSPIAHIMASRQPAPAPAHRTTTASGVRRNLFTTGFHRSSTKPASSTSGTSATTLLKATSSRNASDNDLVERDEHGNIIMDQLPPVHFPREELRNRSGIPEIPLHLRETYKKHAPPLPSPSASSHASPLQRSGSGSGIGVVGGSGGSGAGGSAAGGSEAKECTCEDCTEYKALLKQWMRAQVSALEEDDWIFEKEDGMMLGIGGIGMRGG